MDIRRLRRTITVPTEVCRKSRIFAKGSPGSSGGEAIECCSDPNLCNESTGPLDLHEFRNLQAHSRMAKNQPSGRCLLKARTFYRLSLLLPLLAPAVAFGLAFVAPGDSVWLPLLGALLASFVYGGAAYVLVALLLLGWMRGRPDREIGRMVWLAPLLMLPAEAIMLPLQSVLLQGRFGPEDWEGAWAAVPVVSAAVLVFGYAYAALTLAVFYVGARNGWITPTDAPSRGGESRGDAEGPIPN